MLSCRKLQTIVTLGHFKGVKLQKISGCNCPNLENSAPQRTRNYKTDKNYKNLQIQIIYREIYLRVLLRNTQENCRQRHILKISCYNPNNDLCYHTW